MNAFSSALIDRDTPGHAGAQPKTLGRILVVDDDSDIRFLETRVLVRSGYRVDTAEDGEAGWEALRSISYDLLITDNNMPRLSGIELVKRLRLAQMRLPVILSSASVGPSEFNRHSWLSIAATVPKPFSKDQLLETVRKVLRAPVEAATSSDTCVALWVRACSQIHPRSRWGINE